MSKKPEKKKPDVKKEIKSFWADFKKFITRGNVLDMAVGVIVGGAFTAIVNGLSNNILKPLINWLIAIIVGADSLDNIHTILFPAYMDKVLEDGTTVQVIDLANSIYIDWGAFINAVINFLLIAFTLFIILRTFTRLHKKMEEKANAEKIAAAKAAEAKAKAEAEAQAAAAAAEAEANAKAEAEAQAQAQEALAQFYRNVQRQTELLEQIAGKQ